MKSPTDRLIPLPLLMVLLALPVAAVDVPEEWLEAKLAQESVAVPLSADDVAALTRAAQRDIAHLQQSVLASKQAAIAYAKALVQSLETQDGTSLPATQGTSHQRLLIAMQNGERRNAPPMKPAGVSREP